MKISGTAARALVRALTLALAAAVAGCSGPDDAPDFGDNDPSIVAALGNSITFGVNDTGVDTCSEEFRGVGGYCPPLGRLAKKTVFNEGICGETSYDGVDRIGDILRRHRPAVILIDYGINDLFSPGNAVVENLRIMIDAARANKTVPIVGTLIPATGGYSFLNPSIEELNGKIRALCLNEEIEYADHWRDFSRDAAFVKDPYALLSEDGLHPNPAGYARMARTWREPLQRTY